MNNVYKGSKRIVVFICLLLGFFFGFLGGFSFIVFNWFPIGICATKPKTIRNASTGID